MLKSILNFLFKSEEIIYSKYLEEEDQEAVARWEDEGGQSERYIQMVQQTPIKCPKCGTIVGYYENFTHYVMTSDLVCNCGKIRVNTITCSQNEWMAKGLDKVSSPCKDKSVPLTHPIDYTKVI